MEDKEIFQEVNFIVAKRIPKKELPLLWGYILDKRTEARVYKSIITRAKAKLNSMFDNGNEDTILDDLLELDKILGGE